MPTLACSGLTVADAYAEWGAMACACSRNAISARRSSGVSEGCSSKRPWRKRTDSSGRRNAALIMPVRIAGSALVRTAAKAGEVDHTSDEAVGESGRKAMGPVGRNR
jgi:hypothetical protein